MQSITESLNKQQAQVVTAEPKSALILAGAGSGKTRVLTSRIAYLLQQNMAHPSEILAVTFTNKAAKEMLARLQNDVCYFGYERPARRDQTRDEGKRH